MIPDSRNRTSVYADFPNYQPSARAAGVSLITM